MRTCKLLLHCVAASLWWFCSVSISPHFSPNCKCFECLKLMHFRELTIQKHNVNVEGSVLVRSQPYLMMDMLHFEIDTVLFFLCALTCSRQYGLPARWQLQVQRCWLLGWKIQDGAELWLAGWLLQIPAPSRKAPQERRLYSDTGLVLLSLLFWITLWLEAFTFYHITVKQQQQNDKIFNKISTYLSQNGNNCLAASHTKERHIYSTQ